MQIGHRLQQVRQHRGLSQGRLAKAIGVTVGTVQHYEHGRVPITVDRIEQLALALHCEIVELLAPPGAPVSAWKRRAG